MKSILLISLILATSLTASADTISIVIGGKDYTCTSSGSSAPARPAPPQVTRVYCECAPPPLVSLRRIAIMSDGSTQVVSSTPYYPDNGSFNPDEAARNCERAARQCN